ncbi:MAG: T9SS type A sorting domain-containing protein [Saprospiraceae bacterium]|nr:T9SS type A sorting domain-containing protein [Saprospiraceae bacterium]
MKNLLFTLVLLCLNGFLFGQNTTVQTLTLDDNSTSGSFSFPDEPGQSFEKIWMVYQMRCHEGLVGSGAVGCREWDYSCNTFLTDPTRIDSSKATHPTHLIPGFSEDAFPYTTDPTFSLLTVNQQEMVHGTLVQGSSAKIGTGLTPLTLYSGADQSKSQLLFPASELIAEGLTAGLISDITMDILNDSDAIEYFRIALKHTSKVALNPADPDLVGFEEVYIRDTDFPGVGEFQFDFYQPFLWDGVSNIIMEITYNSPNTGVGNTAAGSEILYDGVLYSETDDYHIELNGSGEIEYDVTNFQQLSEEVTISFWAYGDTAAIPSNTTILDAVNANNQRTMNIHLPWGNSRVYWDCGNDGGSYDRIDKAANIEDLRGQWNHWAFTKNANTGTMRIFLNGELWHSGTAKTRLIDLSRFVLGKAADGSRFFPGLLDEFRVWKKELSVSAIQDWMQRKLTADHPNYADLVSYLPFDEGEGGSLTDLAPSAPVQEYSGASPWRTKKGQEQFKGFSIGTYRPNVTFHQNTYMGDSVIVTPVLDTLFNLPYAVNYYSVAGTDLVLDNTEYFWLAETQTIYDADGMEVGIIFVSPDGSIDIGTLNYYAKRDAKFELLSFVTPYGNGLDLGPEGKTWWFDVTDYAPILKGERFLSVEMGGQSQEELDIKFIFVPGTPTREVVNMQNVWPFARGWFDPIQNEEVFEERTVPLDENGTSFKIRSSITGHGQNGEFIPREHYININGGTQEFKYEVWKECGDNPVYPQGGTWTFDRAGWCPGMATDVREFDITSLGTPGSSVTIDYGLNGSTMAEANYLVANQLVTYGPPNFELDAELLEIQRPSDRDEFARTNPNCDDALIIIQNAGSTNLTTLEITYGITGGTQESITWLGNLSFNETAEVILPIDDLYFWETNSSDAKFEVSISSPNGGTDQRDSNNSLSSSFEQVEMFDQPGLEIELRTNQRPQENKLTLRDGSGNILGELDNMASQSNYIQEIDFPAGCYSFTLEDSNDDGLHYWYWDAIGQSVGSGFLRITYALNDQIQIPIKSFEPEFGGDLHYSFSIPLSVANKDLDELRKFSLFPNPTSSSFNLELEGISAGMVVIEIFTQEGKLLRSFEDFVSQGKLYKEISTQGIPSGMYQVKVSSSDRFWVKPLVKID